MGVKEIYHPRHAIADPEAYYDAAFENCPGPQVVPVIGRIAAAYANPSISFHDAENETEYFSRIEDGPKLLTFTHFGKKRFHDTSAAAAVVFKTESLLDKVSELQVWAAVHI